MPPESCQVWQCENSSCQFRFPVLGDKYEGEHCPQCGKPIRLVEESFSLNNKTPRVSPSDGPVVDVLLDNIRSSYNVGSIFRTADGAGIKQIHLCGITPTPINSKVAKTALGAEKSVHWTYSKNALSVARGFKKQERRLWGLELTHNSRSIFVDADSDLQTPIVLVVGNERCGIDPAIISICDRIIHLPMQGHKTSLNVVVAFGIAAYYLRFGRMQTLESGHLSQSPER